MVSTEKVRNQLEALHFNVHGWGRSEANELPHILMPDEEIYDLVNGIYEGGFALLVATNMRILLVDKKPLNYLTVEDLRFDMISEIDYSHRIIGANLSVSTGSKNLRFMSFNQPRLRKLTTHVQHIMAAQKKKANEHRQDQKDHLEQINQQLQAYLLAQHRQNQQMNQALGAGRQRQVIDVEPFDSEHRTADYLYAQSLLSQYPGTRDQADIQALQLATGIQNPTAHDLMIAAQSQASNELYAEGVKEIFGANTSLRQHATDTQVQGFEVNPMRVAYSKLPTILQERFGRPLPQNQAAATR